MYGLTLYFVGYYRHDGIQHLEAGPFVSATAAYDHIKEEWGSGNTSHVICQVDIPLQVSLSK
jgi:hypothetical protein